VPKNSHPKAIDLPPLFDILPAMKTKTLMAILLSFIMAQAPVMGRYYYNLPGGAGNTIGTYAGVLIPTSDPSEEFAKGSLGLFTLSIPSNGLGSGTVVVFSTGRTFSGTITAVTNPDSSSDGITGVLTATYDYTLYVSSSDTEDITADAEGPFNAAVVNNSNSVGGLGIDLTGTCNLGIDQGFVNGSSGNPIIAAQVTFAIDGFEQSSSATTTSGS